MRFRATHRHGATTASWALGTVVRLSATTLLLVGTLQNCGNDANLGSSGTAGTGSSEDAGEAGVLVDAGTGDGGNDSSEAGSQDAGNADGKGTDSGQDSPPGCDPGIDSATTGVLYWWTAENYDTLTAFPNDVKVDADIGFAKTEVSNGTEDLPADGGLANNAESWAITIALAPNPPPARPGKQALRIELRRDDYKNRGHRAELKLPNAPGPGVYWYAWSVYLPSPSSEVQDESAGEFLGQFHGADKKYSPPLDLDRYRYPDADAHTWIIDQRPKPEVAKHYKVGVADLDVWTDWVIQVKWTKEATGFLNVWKDGDLALSLGDGGDGGLQTDYSEDPDSGDNKDYPIFKFGIYKWPWKDAKYAGGFPTRVVYYDEIKVGGACETYESMKPRR